MALERAYGGRGVAVKSGSGDPSGVGKEGDLYLDTVAKRFWIYTGGSWFPLGTLS